MENAPLKSDFRSKTSIYRGCSIATFLLYQYQYQFDDFPGEKL